MSANENSTLSGRRRKSALQADYIMGEANLLEAMIDDRRMYNRLCRLTDYRENGKKKFIL